MEVEGMSRSLESIDGVDSTFHFLAPVFFGIIMCRIIYKATGFLSSLCFKSYGNLTKTQKIEWDNRGISTVHAVFAAAASMYLLLFSGLFDEGPQTELLVNRNSFLSNTVLGISIGYFLSDVGMIFWFYPVLGGMEYVLHHGLSMLALVLSLVSSQAQFYILIVLFTEITTPSVNLRWYLDVAGRRSSMLYVYNGIALFLGWLVARVLIFIYFFTHIFLHFDQIKQIFPLGFYSLLTIPPTLALMNVFWFWKIVKGLIKTLSKTRHTK